MPSKKARTVGQCRKKANTCESPVGRSGAEERSWPESAHTKNGNYA